MSNQLLGQAILQQGSGMIGVRAAIVERGLDRLLADKDEAQTVIGRILDNYLASHSLADADKVLQQSFGLMVLLFFQV